MDSKGVVQLDQMRAYAQRHGAKQTEECLRRLGVLQQFYNAYSTVVGKELLACVNSELVRLAERVLTNPGSDEDDKAMYRAYSAIAQVWAKKVSEYENLVRSIQESELPG